MFSPLTAKANIAPQQTDANVVTAVPGRVIVVVGGFVVCAGSVTLTLNTKPSGSGTAITSDMPFGANGGICWPAPDGLPIGQPPIGYFSTNKGEGLSATTGAGASVGITVRYVLV